MQPSNRAYTHTHTELTHGHTVVPSSSPASQIIPISWFGSQGFLKAEQMAKPARRAGLVSQLVLPAMDLMEMATQLPVGVEVLQTRTHTLSLCSCMGPVLRIPWTNGLDTHTHTHTHAHN